MSDSVLLKMIKEAVGKIIDDQGGKDENGACKQVIDGLKPLVLAGIEDAVKAYRDKTADHAAYESSLGAFIVEQNPYASWEDIDFPGLPLDPNGENRWVRRSGVLADYNALNPLPPDKPIPGGIVVNFSYIDWPELKDYRDDEHPGQMPPAEVFIKPKADVELASRPVPFKNRFYPHNVVKAVRLRYTVFDRRYAKSGTEVTEDGLARDKQISYIMILYSGGDSQ